MPSSRSLARWLLTAFLLALFLVPLGLLEGRAPAPACQCGMAPGHCSCALNGHARAGGHASCGGGDRCALRSPEPPAEGRTLPLGPELRVRLGVFRHGAPGVGREPCGTLAALDALPASGPSAPPEIPPPRLSSRIG